MVHVLQWQFFSDDFTEEQKETKITTSREEKKKHTHTEGDRDRRQGR